MEDDDAVQLAQMIADGIKYARAMEVCLSALAFMAPVIVMVGRLHDVDGDLGPEVKAAINHLDDAAMALTRAATFLSTKFEVQMGMLPDE